MPSFPHTRMRRNRTNDNIRRLVAEVTLNTADLIWPLFVTEEKDAPQEIKSMPGVFRHSINGICDEVKKAEQLGISAVAIFPHIDKSLKNDRGSEALDENNLICRTIQAIKKIAPDMCVICDVALDPYTNHGHDGILKNGIILNDETNEILVKQALLMANAGCDTIAPSDMMDGRIGLIRRALDDKNFQSVRILSYSAKYASAYYGPFRDAVGSDVSLHGDKKTYQMDPANRREAIREIALDIDEGADMVMIKPAGAYLDIISQARENFDLPIIAYQVSGEYSMIKAAALKGWLDEEKIMLESVLACKRAGANAILTYFALQIAEYLNRH